jgi:hypothetical protein
VVCDIPDHILAPNEWVVVIGLELIRYKLCPGIERLEPLLAECVSEVALNSLGARAQIPSGHMVNTL